MATLIGIILDLSESMKTPVYEKIDKNDGKRSSSIFKVVDDLLVKENILTDYQVFAIGFGTRCEHPTIDIIGTLKYFQDKYAKPKDTQDYSKILGEVIDRLNVSYSTIIKRWLLNFGIKRLEKAIPFYYLSFILDALTHSNQFRDDVVSTCLPDSLKAGSWYDSVWKLFFPPLITNEDIDIMVQKIQTCFHRYENLKKLCMIEGGSVYGVNETAEIMRYWFEGKTIDEKRVKKVLRGIEPFIYGKQKLIKALEKSSIIFKKNKYSEHKKYLFVLSDGVSSENWTDEPTTQLKAANVKVVSCFISDLPNIGPRRLYNEEDPTWDEEAKLMFKLSSTIRTHILPYLIFENSGWKIDKNTNETKLFLQINHPDNISEACNTAKYIVSSQDALIDFLGNISISKYIQKVNKRTTAKRQEKETCYANAVAAVIHLSTKRIINRVGGYPDFYNLREDIISAFGESGAYILSVLDMFCSDYRLHFRKVNGKKAMEAIASKRPIITTFYLQESEWDVFSNFFHKNSTGIITKNEIDTRNRAESEKLSGHAVVLTNFNSDCLLFMNSWGDEWGDMGFFRVQNDEVFDFEFYDVYWTEEDLLEPEKVAYEEYGINSAHKLVDKLKGLRSATFNCPECHQESPVRYFGGTFKEAICPQKGCIFDCSSEGNPLAMNLYLVTLLGK